jgi:hypothetical protein
MVANGFVKQGLPLFFIPEKTPGKGKTPVGEWLRVVDQDTGGISTIKAPLFPSRCSGALIANVFKVPDCSASMSALLPLTNARPLAEQP